MDPSTSLCAGVGGALGSPRDDRPEDPLCTALAAVPRRGTGRRAGATRSNRRNSASAAQISRADHAGLEKGGAGPERAWTQGRLSPRPHLRPDFFRGGGKDDGGADRFGVLRERQFLRAVWRLSG